MRQRSTTIDAIDGLRGIAVLSVILFHLEKSCLPGGFVGVDVFFVISGYVVCRSLAPFRAHGFMDFIFAFYARRLRRIYPALLVMLLGTVTLSRMFIPESYLSGDANRTGFFAIFGVSNIQLLMNESDYFGVLSDFNPFLHTWSLGVEEQFYLVFPLLWFLVERFRTSPWARLLLPAAFGASLACCAFQQDSRIAFFAPWSRFWELAAGALLCAAHGRGRFVPGERLARNAASLLGISLLAASFAFADERAFPWALPPVAGTVCCIAAVVQARPGDLLASALQRAPLTYVGRMSYSLYLWHWPLIVLARWTVGLESPGALAAAVFGTAVLAALSYHLVELRCQRALAFEQTRLRLETGSGSTRRTAACELPGSVAFVLLALATIYGSGLLYCRLEASWRLPLSVTFRPRVQTNPWQPEGEGIVWNGISRSECREPWGGRTLFMLGDSHSQALRGIVAKLRREECLSIYMNGVGGARVVSLVNPHTESSRRSERQALEAVKNLARPGDVVVLSSLRVPRFCDQWAAFDIDKVVRQRDGDRAEALRTQAVREGCDAIRELLASQVHVVITAPLPVFYSPPFRCSDWFNRMNPIGRRGLTVNREVLLEHRRHAMRSIAEVRQNLPAVRVWDPFPILCPGEDCCAFDGDKPLFFDGDHLSGYGNEKLYADFLGLLREIWGAEAVPPCPGARGEDAASLGRREADLHDG